MSETRDTYKYEFKVGDRVVYVGVTNDLSRREEEHKRRWPDGYIVQVGHKTTREKALEWAWKDSRKLALSKS